MLVTHKFTISCSCPVDGGADTYAVTVRARRCIKVEDIDREARRLASVQQFQEDLTRDLARCIGAEVTTVGFHSGFKTTVVCGVA